MAVMIHVRRGVRSRFHFAHHTRERNGLKRTPLKTYVRYTVHGSSGRPDVFGFLTTVFRARCIIVMSEALVTMRDGGGGENNNEKKIIIITSRGRESSAANYTYTLHTHTHVHKQNARTHNNECERAQSCDSHTFTFSLFLVLRPLLRVNSKYGRLYVTSRALSMTNPPNAIQFVFSIHGSWWRWWDVLD
jgi:hypothetical protein